MTQARRPDGKFGGKATDITKQDVKRAIQFVANELDCSDAKVILKQPPVKVNAKVNADVTTSMGIPEFVLYAIIVTVVTIFLLTCTLYVWARV